MHGIKEMDAWRPLEPLRRLYLTDCENWLHKNTMDSNSCDLDLINNEHSSCCSRGETLAHLLKA